MNPWSGGGKAERFGILDAAGEAGIEVRILQEDDDLVELAKSAIAGGADAIGAGGGDGSLGLIAGLAVEHDIPFFCVPLGTRNHFALDLGLDRDDPLRALEAVRNGDELRIDYALANDRPFLNNVSLGVYAEAVHRDEYRDHKQRTIASVISEIGTENEGGTALRFSTPWGGRAQRTPMTLISNNPYTWSGPPDYGRRIRLDRGRLGIVGIGSGTTATGRWTRRVRRWKARSFSVEADGPVRAGVDGEALEFDSPLHLTIRPKALRVLVPAGTRPGYVPSRGSFVAEVTGLARLAGVAGD